MKTMKAGTFEYGLALLVLTTMVTAPVEAFVERSFGFSSASLKHTRPAQGLYSSSDDDELSKLIGKRSQIKRLKKEELPKGDDLLDPDSLDTSSSDYLEKLPDFQTPRVARTPKKKDEGKNPRASSSNEPTYLDYYADYEDENEFHIPNRMGISTRCWGDEKEGFVSSGKLKKQQLREGKFVPGDLQVAYNNLLSEGILLFETSPDYGSAMASKKLSAEDIMARCIQESYKENEQSPLLVGTFANKIWQRGAGGLTNSLSKSCERLEVSGLEVYQVKSLGWLPSGGLVKGMNEAVIDSGTVNYVGVQNVAPLRLRRFASKLDAQGLQLMTNSFEFSLTNRKNEKWIQACKTLGVIPLITNPLGSGLASGQYTASNPSGGVAGEAKFSFATLDKLQPLHSVLETVAERVKTRVARDLKDLKDRYRGRGPEVSAFVSLL
jgi:aryl-alcohol dehydrogenase-like predicted oxidoreductase